MCVCVRVFMELHIMHVCLLSAHLFSARQSWQAMWVLTCARCRQMCACLRARAKVSVCVHCCMRVHGRLVRICRWMLTRTPPHNTTGTCSPRRQRRYVFVCRIMRVRVGRSKRVCVCARTHTQTHIQRRRDFASPGGRSGAACGCTN